jgi:protein-tyrosine phosphatase
MTTQCARSFGSVYSPYISRFRNSKWSVRGACTAVVRRSEKKKKEERGFELQKYLFERFMLLAMAQHPTYELPVDDSALLLMPCPGTKGPGLQASLEQLRDQGVKAIVTLITDEEMKEKNVTTLGTNAGELGIRWYHFSIEDDRVPDENFATGWAEASPELHQVLKDGGKVAIHCMGGSGRTGMVTAHLLLEKGWELTQIVQIVKYLRPGAYTAPGQLEYVESIATKLQTKDHL